MQHAERSWVLCLTPPPSARTEYLVDYRVMSRTAMSVCALEWKLLYKEVSLRWWRIFFWGHDGEFASER